MSRTMLACCVAWAVTGCTEGSAEPPSTDRDAGPTAPGLDGGDAGGEPAPGPIGGRLPDGAAGYRLTLDTLADYEDVAGADAGTKYLARVDGAALPAPLTEDCYFQNARAFPYHVDFLRTFPGMSNLAFEEYSSWVTTRAARSLWGGDVTYFPDARHPITAELGVVGFAVYANETDADALTIDEIAEVNRRLGTCMPFASGILVFIPLGARQTAILRDRADELLAAGVTPIPPASL